MSQIASEHSRTTFKLIKVDDALKAILGHVERLPYEEIELGSAFHRVIAEDVYADANIPQFDNSAMDGYAVCSSDTVGVSETNPKILKVVDDVRAGYVSSRIINKGEAIRIMTGAPLPNGADSVIMVEYTEKEGADKIKIFTEVKLGKNIRKAGEDIKKGELVIQKGTLLDSAHMGVLASLGMPKVKVSRKPKVAVLATGDEVIDVNEKLEPGKLHNSNAYTLSGQTINCGGIPKDLGIARDNPEDLEKKIKEGLNCDAIITSGGVSVGDYDFVKFVLSRLGTDIKFWKVAMKPGKPLVFGVIPAKGGNNIPIFGLPGNPVSSMISFEVFARPAILKMLGQNKDERKEVNAVLEEDIQKKRGLRYFLRAQTRWEDGLYFTRTTGVQGSGILKSMVLANSLIVLAEEEEIVKKGSKVTVRFL